MSNNASSIQHCKRCAYPSNHALGISFNNHGICSGCIVHEEKDTLDWHVREQKLAKILNQYRNKAHSNYDCIIPISGGKDSFFIVDLIKNKYGMNPLLVSFNKHYNTRGGIYNLEHIRTLLGCDIATMTLNPEIYKKLIRFSIETLGSFHWPYLAGSTVYPVQMAVKKKVPLIIWGAHQGLDQVGMFSHLDEVEMTRRYRKEHDLMGLEPEDVLNGNNDIQERDIATLFYPKDEELYNSNVRGIYLGNYVRWDTKSQHETMLKKYAYYASTQLRTFDTYNDVDCLLYNNLHDEVKFRKFGYSKINDHVAREIRFGRLDYQQGLDMIKRYQGYSDYDASWFFKWIGMSKINFWKAVDEHRDISVRKDSKKSEESALIPPNLSTHDIAAAALGNRESSPLAFQTSMPEVLIGVDQQRQFMLRGNI